MSTRAQIVVKGNEEAKIYKHSDGYPDGVMPVLTELLQQFIAERGNDPEYCTAQIIRAFARDNEEHRIKQLEHFEKEISILTANKQEASFYKTLKESYSKPSMLSWGVSNDWYLDIEYFYYVDLEKETVDICSPNDAFDEDPKLENMELIQRVKIVQKPELKLV